MTSEEKFQRDKRIYEYFINDLKEVFEKHSCKLKEMQEPFYGGCDEFTQLIFNGNPWISWSFEESLRNINVFEND